MNRWKKKWEVRRHRVLLKHWLRKSFTHISVSMYESGIVYMNTSLKGSVFSNVIFFTLEDFNVTVVLSLKGKQIFYCSLFFYIFLVKFYINCFTCVIFFWDLLCFSSCMFANFYIWFKLMSFWNCNTFYWLYCNESQIYLMLLSFPLITLYDWCLNTGVLSVMFLVFSFCRNCWPSHNHSSILCSHKS